MDLKQSKKEVGDSLFSSVFYCLLLRVSVGSYHLRLGPRSPTRRGFKILCSEVKLYSIQFCNNYIHVCNRN